jgi:hypothetical protein
MEKSKDDAAITPLMVRFPRALHARIKRLAQEENRSLNAQVVTLVQEALAAREPPRRRKLPLP